MIVLEAIPRDLAAKITGSLKIPTIGIGAGERCDGQVLVLHDLLDAWKDAWPKQVGRAYTAEDLVLPAPKPTTSPALTFRPTLTLASPRRP